MLVRFASVHNAALLIISLFDAGPVIRRRCIDPGIISLPTANLDERQHPPRVSLRAHIISPEVLTLACGDIGLSSSQFGTTAVCACPVGYFQ